MHPAVELVAGLDSLRHEGILCDVELQAEEQTLPAHRAVLAAASPFFKTMFTGNFKEATDKVVHMKDISFPILQEIVSSIYTTKISLTSDNVREIFSAAHVMELERIHNECTAWMLKNIQTSTCLLYLHLAEQYEIQELENAMKNYILANFCDIIQQEKDLFNAISQPALCRYLSSDFLRNDYNEMAVFRAAKDWILSKEIVEENDVYEIMKNIRFTLIGKDELSSIICDDFITSRKQCHDMVGEAMKYHMDDTYSQPFYEDCVKPRGKSAVLIFHHLSRGPLIENETDVRQYVCGIGENQTVKQDVCDPYHQQILPDGLCVEYHSLLSINIKNFLFVFGVSRPDYRNFTKRYDASINVWLDLAAIPREPLVEGCIAHSGKDIYLFGGVAQEASSRMGFVERNRRPESTDISNQVFSYTVDQNSWSTCPDMPFRPVCSAAATLQGHIYVTGGCKPKNQHVTAVPTVYSYDVNAKVWQTKPPMNQARCEHIANVVNNKLYVVGGRCPLGEYMRRNIRRVPEVEAYDPVTNQWTITHEHYQPHPPPFPDVVKWGYPFGSCSLVLFDKIFIIGGGTLNEGILVYDTVENKMIRGYRIGAESSSRFDQMICAPLTVQ